jgi:hypothetical protein
MAEKKKTTATEAPETAAVDPNAEAEKILAEARAQAAEIVANAKKEAEAAVEAAKEAQAPAANSGDELVPIRLFKDNERYKDDVFVAINGKSWQIKRGETVEVPKYVADVLEQSMKQDMATANMIEQKSAEYEAEASRRGV